MNIINKFVFLLIACAAASSIGAMQSDATPASDLQTSVPGNSRPMARYTKDGVTLVICCPGKFERQLHFSIDAAEVLLSFIYKPQAAPQNPVHSYAIENISEQAVEAFYNIVVLAFSDAQMAYIKQLWIQKEYKLVQELIAILDTINFKNYTCLLSSYAQELLKRSAGEPGSTDRAHELQSRLTSRRKNQGIKIIFESAAHTEKIRLQARIAQRLRKLSDSEKQHQANSEGGFKCQLRMVPVGIKLDFLKACCLPSGAARKEFYQKLTPTYAAALTEIFEKMKGTSYARRACWLGLARASQPDEASAAAEEPSRKRPAPALERDEPAKRAETTEYTQPTLTPDITQRFTWLPVPTTAHLLQP